MTSDLSDIPKIELARGGRSVAGREIRIRLSGMETPIPVLAAGLYAVEQGRRTWIGLVVKAFAHSPSNVPPKTIVLVESALGLLGLSGRDRVREVVRKIVDEPVLDVRECTVVDCPECGRSEAGTFCRFCATRLRFSAPPSPGAIILSRCEHGGAGGVFCAYCGSKTGTRDHPESRFV